MHVEYFSGNFQEKYLVKHKTFNVSKMEWQVFCVSCRTIWCNFSTTFPFVLWDTVDRHKFWFLRIQCLNCWWWYESQKNYPYLVHWIEIVLLIKMKSRTIPFAWLKLAFFGNSGPSIQTFRSKESMSDACFWLCDMNQNSELSFVLVSLDLHSYPEKYLEFRFWYLLACKSNFKIPISQKSSEF